MRVQEQETSRDRLDVIVERLDAIVAELPPRLRARFTPKPDAEPTSHTPGPWRLATTGLGIFSRSTFIARGGHFWGDSKRPEFDRHAPVSPSEATANARLIAAAPDLLAACKETIEYCNECDKAGIAPEALSGSDNYPCLVCGPARKAIALAERGTE